MTPTPHKCFRVDLDLWQAAQEKAAREGVTVTDVLVGALRAFVGASEDGDGDPQARA